MGKRHRDALAIQQGAVNPSGIALSIVEACKEMRAEPNHTGTREICRDPAIRLMVHQLAHICNAEDTEIGQEYGALTQACRDALNVTALGGEEVRPVG